MSLTVAEYMNLRCICGTLRRSHAHTYDDQMTPDGIYNPHPTQLHVIELTTGCQAFTWELERELGGNPFANKHLAPLLNEGD